MGELTDEAKAEIAAAVQIVREDRMEKFVRETLGKHTPKPTDPPTTEPPTNDPPKNDPPNVPPKDGPPAPPPKVDPPTDPPAKRRGIWWGDVGGDDE